MSAPHKGTERPVFIRSRVDYDVWQAEYSACDMTYMECVACSDIRRARRRFTEIRRAWAART